MMKRLIAATLMLVLLIQAFPMDALAGVGDILTESELSSLYALTGLDEKAPVYHVGMEASGSMNAQQLVGWLEDIMQNDLHTVGFTLGRAASGLEFLKVHRPNIFQKIAGTPHGIVLFNHCMAMQNSVEDLRLTLRHYKDSLQETSTVISELGGMLSSDQVFDYEKCRYSERVRQAGQTITEIRTDIQTNGDSWNRQINQWVDICKGHYSGDNPLDRELGEWITQILLAQRMPIRQETTLTTSKSASSLKGRLKTGESVLNADPLQATTITVISDNQIAIVLKNKEGKPVSGAKVRLRDANKPDDPLVEKTTDTDGSAVFEISKFTVDDTKQLQVYMEVDAQNYQSFSAPFVAIKKGGKHTEYLTKDDGSPYIYSGTFREHDMMRSELEVLFSSLNDRDVDIAVTFRNTKAEPVLCLKDMLGKEKVIEANKTSSGEYIFTDKWIEKLDPKIYANAKYDKVYFRLRDPRTKKLSDKAYAPMLKLTASIFDKPTDLTSIFTGLSDGVGFEFKITKINRTVSVRIGVGDLLPRFTADIMGNVTIAIGAQLPSLKKEWQDCWADDYEKIKGKIASSLSVSKFLGTIGQQAKGIKEKSLQAFSKNNVKLSMYLILQEKWQKDFTFDDFNLLFTGGGGVIASFSACYTYPFTIGPVPLYIDAEFGAGVSVGTEFQIRLTWEHGKFAHFFFYPFNQITLVIRISVGFTIGLGVKGFASIWIKGSAAINFQITFFTNRVPALLISATAGVSAGVTIFFVFTASVDVIKGNWVLYNSEGKSAYSLLEHYMPNAQDPSGDDKFGQQPLMPESYPNLLRDATKEFTDATSAPGGVRILELGGEIYAFYIGNGRVKWRNLSRKGDVSGSIDDVLPVASMWFDDSVPVAQLKDYAFDVRVCPATMGGDLPVHPRFTAIDDFFMVAGLCAKSFDDDGYPLAGAQNSAMYVIGLWRQASTGALVFAVNGLQDDFNGAYNVEWMGGEGEDVGFVVTEPHIAAGSTLDMRWGQFTMTGGYFIDVNLYANVGFAELKSAKAASEQRRIGVLKTNCSSLYDALDDNFTPDWKVHNYVIKKHDLTTDADVASGKDGYVRVSAVPKVSADGARTDWIALSKPDNDTTGKGALEIYDTSMNAAASGKRKAMVLAEGYIGDYVLIEGATEKDPRMVFFADDADTQDPSANRYRLKSLRIEPTTYQDAGKGNLKLNVVTTVYDVDLSTKHFKVQKIGNLYYIYWLAGGHPDEKGGSGDGYRIMYCAWDPATNTLSDRCVFAAFTLADKDSYIREVFLTESGKGYFISAPVEKKSSDDAGSAAAASTTLNNFQTTLGPKLDLKGQVIADLAVCPGDYDDVTITVMNSGNVAVTSFDVEIVKRTKDKDDSVGLIHFDLLDPKNNYVIMEGKVVKAGKDAAYRLDDFSNTPRQRDFLLSETGTTYNVSGGTLQSQDKNGDKKNYVKTDAMMPGALAGFTGVLRIPDDWTGQKVTIELRIKSMSTFRNWMGAIAAAGGRESLVSNAADDLTDYGEITYSFDSDAGLMTMADECLSDEANAMFAASVDAPESVNITTLHDLDVSHRVYPGPNGEKMLSITIIDHAENEEPVHMYAEVYLDEETEPFYVNLPYYPDVVSDAMTHTIDLPLSALTDPDAHEKLRMVILGANIDEVTLVNNEFTLDLGGSPALHFTREIEGEITRAGKLNVYTRTVHARQGETVTLRAGVAGGKKPYKYQWQVYDPKTRRWVDLADGGRVSGANTAALMLSNVPIEWDGRKARCVVTDAAGEVIVSDAILLRVAGAGGGGGEMPDTGDHAKLPLYIAIALVAAALLIFVRRRERDGR